MIKTQYIISDFPKIRGKRNKEILQIICEQLSFHGRIRQPELDRIHKTLQGTDYRLRLKTLRRLAHVLTVLKDWHGVDTIIPPVPIPSPRNSILPETAEEFAWLDGISLLEEMFWKEWLGVVLATDCSSKDEKYESLIFAFAFSLATDASLHSIQIADILAKLCWRDIIDEGKSIKLMVHPSDRLKRYSILNLPTPTRLIFHSLFKSKKTNDNNQPFLFPSVELKFKKKKIRVNRIISSRYLAMHKLAREKEPDIPLPPTWSAFTRISHMIGFDRGLEPFMISAVRRYPLPVSHPIESSLRIYGNQMPHHTLPIMLSPTTSSTLIKRPSLKSVAFHQIKKEKKTESAWCGESKTILKQLVNKLKLITKKEIKTDIQVRKAQELIEHSLEEANHLAPSNKSALHLALNWIRDYITKKRSIRPSTVHSYFSRAFYNGLLTFGDSDDLSLWDTEDHELAIEAPLSSPKLSPSYKKDIITVIKMVYPYAIKNGYAENVNVSFIADEWVGSSTRIEMIGLHRFDAFIRLMMETGDRGNGTISVAAILAFYGGLRAGETTGLTLNDIDYNDGELNINLPSGKTPAALRRVPLHLFAPDYLCDIVKDYARMRLDEFRKSKFSRKQPILKNIPLFGPEKSKKVYTRKSLIDATITELKNHFGPDFVYHSLRHSFSSWLLIRWYAGRYENFPNDLAERHHPVFRDESQARLNSYFTPEDGTIPDHSASDLVKISKVIGHLGQETLFSTYVHSFDAIHCHAMARMSEIQGKIELSGRTISALVPKMKDRHNHSKLPGRTINDICDYLGLR